MIGRVQQLSWISLRPACCCPVLESVPSWIPHILLSQKPVKVVNLTTKYTADVGHDMSMPDLTRFPAPCVAGAAEAVAARSHASIRCPTFCVRKSTTRLSSAIISIFSTIR